MHPLDLGIALFSIKASRPLLIRLMGVWVYIGIVLVILISFWNQEDFGGQEGG
jgi:hypothetical protein